MVEASGLMSYGSALLEQRASLDVRFRGKADINKPSLDRLSGRDNKGRVFFCCGGCGWGAHIC